MKEFKANPLGKGNNKLFPPKIQILEEGVKYIQQGAFKGTEFLVPYSEIRDVNISTPFIGFASIEIYGGKFSRLDPISGFSNYEVREMKEYIELGKKDVKKLHAVLSGKADIEDYEDELDDDDDDIDDEVESTKAIQPSEVSSKEEPSIKETAKTVETSKPVGPPPPPSFSFYALIDNKQYGPYDKVQFKRLVDNDMVTDKTYVWTEGMDNWKQAKDVSEMEEFFPKSNLMTPPPPPPSPQGPPPPPIG
jgi:hypothetical protein